jgi:hypothetical protein
MKKKRLVVIEADLIDSQAHINLKGKALTILMRFFTKRQMKQNSSSEWICINNGEIVFTYREAREKLGLHSAQFTRGIDNLIAVGFIDIAHSGSGTQKDPSLYAMSERWRKYGQSDFEHKERETEQRSLGFLGRKKKTVNSNIIKLASRK